MAQNEVDSDHLVGAAGEGRRGQAEGSREERETRTREELHARNLSNHPGYYRDNHDLVIRGNMLSIGAPM